MRGCRRFREKCRLPELDIPRQLLELLVGAQGGRSSAEVRHVNDSNFGGRRLAGFLDGAVTQQGICSRQCLPQLRLCPRI